MISLEDCIAFSGLTEEEILAIAEHEHIPEAVACGLAKYLETTPGGGDVILIPEIPFTYDSVCAKVREREAEGKHFTLVLY